MKFGMRTYVKAEPGDKSSVIYTDDSGKQWKFEGGSWAWRNQNPGNLVPGAVSKRNHAIGKAGGFAVFPDYNTGHAALLDSLINTYGEKNIESLMKGYAPDDKNDTKRYIAFVRKKTGVKDNKKVKDFTKEEFEKLWHAIEQMEGWKEGKISEYFIKKQIISVKKGPKGVIYSYNIEGYGWVSKAAGVKLVLQGKVDAVVSYTSKGAPFLRARPNQETFDNLVYRV